VLGCGTSKEIVKKTVTHDHFNISFAPEIIHKSGSDQLGVSIAPIDAKSLNRETFDAASRDGNYEKELTTAIEKQREELSKLPKAERTIINGKINGINAINKLEQDKIIPAFTAYQLRLRVWFGETYGKDGTEVASLSDIEVYADNFNPYKINDKYLSVFKVTFENKGNEILKVSIKEFQFLSGEELLYPLGMDYFENSLKSEPEKIKNAYRMNMPDELLLAPKQKAIKYISIPAINPKNLNLSIQKIKEKEVVNFEFKVIEKALRRNYQFESYDIYQEGLDNYNYYYYSALTYQNGPSFATASGRIFVSEENKSSPASVYVIAIDRYKSEVKTAYRLNIRLVDQKNNRIVMPFR
jgi:hypothetical protein